MTENEQPTTAEPSSRARPVWILWLVAGALVIGCACSLGALLVLRRAGDLEWVQNLWPLATPPVAAPTATQPVAAATATQLPTHTATMVLPSPTTKSSTATPMPSSTATLTLTPQPARTAAPGATATLQASPTPFVCDSVYELANIQQLAPGQAFACTIEQQELTDLANDYPDSPCSQTRFTMDDGEIKLECRMGLRMQATLAATAKDCRVSIRVLGGTPGFRQVVQELLTTQFNVIRYDSICVDQVDVDGGQLIVSGYGR